MIVSLGSDLEKKLVVFIPYTRIKSKYIKYQNAQNEMIKVSPQRWKNNWY